MTSTSAGTDAFQGVTAYLRGPCAPRRARGRSLAHMAAIASIQSTPSLFRASSATESSA